MASTSSLFPPINAVHNNRHHNRRFIKSVHFPQQYSIGLSNETSVTKTKNLEMPLRRRDIRVEADSNSFHARLDWNNNNDDNINSMVHNPGKRNKLGNYNIYSYSPPSDCM